MHDNIKPDWAKHSDFLKKCNWFKVEIVLDYVKWLFKMLSNSNRGKPWISMAIAFSPPLSLLVNVESLLIWQEHFSLIQHVCFPQVKQPGWQTYQFSVTRACSGAILADKISQTFGTSLFWPVLEYCFERMGLTMGRFYWVQQEDRYSKCFEIEVSFMEHGRWMDSMWRGQWAPEGGS